MTTKIIHGDCRAILPTLPADAFDCVVTSPPYWGLRDYGVEGQIGLEPTLQGYLKEMVGVCRELRRVLKPEGTFWLNIGDSYNANYRGGGTDNASSKQLSNRGTPAFMAKKSPNRQEGIKPKDLCMIPNRLAIALQEDGWFVRSEIIWHKLNPMPESVRDRPTNSHEKVWLLTKASKYFFDADSIAEEATSPSGISTPQKTTISGTMLPGSSRIRHGLGKSTIRQNDGSRNARNVWSIASTPFKGSHFATMPPDLAERCIKAGCPKGGTVLDPFGGAGTTGLVADRLGRHATLIELNPEYREMAARRVESDAPLFAEVLK
jgi:DNA modification methylase